MYTSKILYIPLFICMFLLFISIILGLSIYSSEQNEFQKNIKIIYQKIEI